MVSVAEWAAAIRSRPFLASAAVKRRVAGVVLLFVILVPFAALNRLPKLDTVREDLRAALAPTAQCFQGFCIQDPDRTSERSGFFGRWWRFSVTYLQLVAIGMLFAFAAAAIAEAFLVSDVSVRTGIATSDGRPGRWPRILKGIGLGPVLNLCSACIAPVSGTLRRGGLGRAIGFSNARPRTRCFAASSTIATRTPGGATKQNRSGRVSASIRSASAYCATSSPSSAAVARIRASSHSHNAATSNRSACASHPVRCILPRLPQPA